MCWINFHVLQPGVFDLVGTIIYEIDQNPYQSTFYNETIEVNEAGGLLSVESVFLFCLGIALISLLVFWTQPNTTNFHGNYYVLFHLLVITSTILCSCPECFYGSKCQQWILFLAKYYSYEFLANATNNYAILIVWQSLSSLVAKIILNLYSICFSLSCSDLFCFISLNLFVILH